MIRYYAALGLQIVGLFVTLDALILYFGQMGPLLRMGTVGVGIFYAGRLIQPKGE
jgi:hypothetical protein